MLWKFIKEHVSTFWQAFIGGGIVWGSILFATPNLLASFILAYIVKLVGAGLLAFITGLFAVLAKDFYEHKIKRKLFKDKDNERPRKQDAA